MEVGVGSEAPSRNAESVLQLATVLPRRARILVEAACQFALDKALENGRREIDAVYVSSSPHNPPFFGSTGPV